MGKKSARKRHVPNLTIDPKVQKMVDELPFKNRKFLIFYENIEGHEFFDDELGSIDRRARHINPMMLFDSINDLKNLLTEVVMVSLSEDTNIEIPFEQQLNILTTKQVYENFNKNLNTEELIQQIKSASMTLEKKQEIFENVINNSNFAFAKELPDNLFQVMSQHTPKGYNTYTDCKSYPYTLAECKLLTLLFIAENTFFSTYAIAMHLDKKIPLWVVELDNHDLLRLFELFLPDFEESLTKEALEKDFPMYQIWEHMEIDLWKKFKTKRFSMQDFLENKSKYLDYLDDVDAESVVFSV